MKNNIRVILFYVVLIGLIILAVDAHHVRRVRHHVFDRRRDRGVVDGAHGAAFGRGSPPALDRLDLRE
ncbi:MAG: hypothetical protein II719_05755, partial [Clostridia bacterium]|nr:hypothetical protein [Clostridia bacterium]